MIDYWEAMGRLATNKALHEKFQSIQPGAGSLPMVAVPLRYDAQTVGVNIPGPDYQRVQDMLSPVLTEQFLSLMSAGELIWTYKFKESRDAMAKLNGLITNAQPPSYVPSTSYFIALGLVIVDGGFRKQLTATGQNVAALLPRLTQTERDQITTLLCADGFEDAAAAVAQLPWDVGCNVSLNYWEGHLHPLGINETPAPTKEAYAASTASAT